jgi:Protein of unknown function (DUF2799)
MSRSATSTASTAARCLAAILLLTLVEGCATKLSEADCRSGNWEAIGYDDGTKGVRQAQSIKHMKNCAKYDVAFDEQAYFSGYERGLEVFCTDENALQMGLDGGKYEGTCSVEKYPRFDARYRAGRVVYEQKVVVARQRTLIQQLQSDYSNLRYQYDSAWDRARRGKDEAERAAAMHELDYIRSRMRQIEYQIPSERERLYYEEQRLRQLMQQLDQSIG